MFVARVLLVFLLPLFSLCAASKEITFSLYIYLNGVELGIYDIPYNLNGALNLDSNGFRKAIYPYLNDVGVGEMNEFLYGQGSIFSTIEEDNYSTPLADDPGEITIDYDDAAKVLYVWMPDAYLNQSFMDKRAQEAHVPLIKSGKTSGYLNITYGHKIFHKYYRELNVPQNQDFANLDLSLNVKDVVFQGFLYAASTNPGIINRGNLILTKDFEEIKARLAVGDQGSYSFGLQNSIPLLGASLCKGMNVFVNPTISSASRNEFFLNAPMKVEVYIDGILYQTMELPAGPHLLQNFPIIQGLNNVKLKITNPIGLEQTISLNSFYEPNLLPTHELEYFLTAGFPNFNEAGLNYNYQFNKPTVMASVRYGFFNNFTLGSYLQGNSTGAYFGTQAVYEYSAVRALFDLGFSCPKDQEIAAKVRLALSKGLLKTAPKLSFDYELSVEAQDKYFSYLQSPIFANPLYLSLAAKLSKKLPWELKSSFTGSYNFDRNNKDRYVAQFKLEKTFFESFLARFLLIFKGKDSRPGGVSSWKNDFFVAFGLDFVPKDTNYRITTDYNQELEALNANANYSTPVRGDSKLDLNIGGSFLQKGASGTGNLNYTGQRFSAGVSQYLANGPLTFSVPDFPTNRNSSLAVTQFNAGTAIAFADGFLALSRPIEDSFALVVSKKNERMRYLRAYKENFKKRFNESFGPMPAVVPSLKSYKETDIHVDIYKKNSWAIEASEQVKVRPHYRSGTLIEPKTIVLKASSKPLKKKKGDSSD